MTGKLIVITGPSGVGKGSVIKEVLTQFDNLIYSISATTRSVREGEKDGINYFFKNKTEFETLIKNEELLEWAEFVGNYYGTLKSFIDGNLQKNISVLLEIEMEGAKQIKLKKPEAKFIFIMPPSIEALKSRLINRNTESRNIIEDRLPLAEKEIKESYWFDYKIVNEDNNLKGTIKELIQILKEMDIE